MSKKKQATFPRELRDQYFPKLEDGVVPTKAQLKAKVLELHEAGQTEDSAKLLGWIEQWKKDQESGVSKASKVVMFSLFVLAGILGVLFFLFNNNDTPKSLVVCSVGGQMLEGEECFNNGPDSNKPAKEEDSKESAEEVLVGDG